MLMHATMHYDWSLSREQDNAYGLAHACLLAVITQLALSIHA